ncbi:uncharacterized protein VTP21DRAFT_327 [Calcarisporiella thermophila]|uniref:uncharacterized protein n=1 Tax=Calcarisporiella thermophila TaxID=911321 RepID=UPI003742DD80
MFPSLRLLLNETYSILAHVDIHMYFENAYALLIGTGANDNGDVDPEYESFIEDAKWLKDILTDESRCAYPPGNVHLILGREATRKNIILGLERLASTSNEDSTVLVLFSGHGFRKGSNQTYLVPTGMRSNDNPEQCAISGDVFYNLIKSIPSKKILLLLNCCYAGGVIPNLLRSEGELALGNTPLTEGQIAQLRDGKGFAVLSSSHPNEITKTGRPGGEHGSLSSKSYSVFVMGVIAALSGWNQKSDENCVRVLDLITACKEYVKEKSKGKQNPYADFHHLDNFPVSYFSDYKEKRKRTRWFLGMDRDFIIDSDSDSDNSEEEDMPMTTSHVSQVARTRNAHATNGGVVISGNFNMNNGRVHFGR